MKRILLAALLLLFSASVYGYGTRCIFIGPSGSDATGDGTVGTPYHSLHKAEQDLSVGVKDTIVVLTGTYTSSDEYWGVLQKLRGTPSNYFVIMGQTGEAKPVLDGLALTITPQYDDNDSLHYFRIQDLVIQNTPMHCINVYDDEYADPRVPVRYVEFSGIEMYNSGYAGFKFARVSQFTIQNCKYEDAQCYDYPGIGFDIVCSRHGVIEDCVLDNLGYISVINNWASSGFMIKGGSYDIIIRDCLIDSVYAACLAGQTTGSDYFSPAVGELDDDLETINYESKDISYYSNIITHASIGLTCSNDIRTKFYHNTFYNPVNLVGEGGGQTYAPYYWVYQKDYHEDTLFVESQDAEIKNNLAVFGSTYHNYVMWCQDAGNLFSTFTMYDNILYCASSPSHSEPDWASILVNADGMCDTLDNLYTLDPLIADPATGEWELCSATSPAYLVGPPLADVTDDYDDVAYGEAVSLGALIDTLDGCEVEAPAAPAGHGAATEYVLIDSYSETTQTTAQGIDNYYNKVSQSFTAIEAQADSCRFYIYRVGTPPYELVAKLYAHSGTYGTSSVPTGTALAVSDTVLSSSIGTSLALTTFTFSGANLIWLDAATYYVLSIEQAGAVAGDSENKILVGVDDATLEHGGNAGRYDTGWSAVATWDAPFYLYGATEGASAADKKPIKSKLFMQLSGTSTVLTPGTIFLGR